MKPLRDQGVLWAALDRAALTELAADPAAQMALDAPAGYAFSSDAAGSLLSRQKDPSGTHGYLPFRHELEAMFIAWGPNIRPGLDLHTIYMTQIGLTLLKAMGIDDPKFGVQPPLREFPSES